MIPDFLPQLYCLNGNTWTLWIGVLANSIIALSYYGIAIGLYKLTQKKILGSIVPTMIWYGFSAFIFLCGTLHIIDVVVVWHPVYNLQNFISTLTASVSAITALIFLPEASRLLRNHSGKQGVMFESHREVERSSHIEELEKILRARGSLK